MSLKEFGLFVLLLGAWLAVSRWILPCGAGGCGGAVCPVGSPGSTEAEAPEPDRTTEMPLDQPDASQPAGEAARSGA